MTDPGPEAPTSEASTSEGSEPVDEVVDRPDAGTPPPTEQRRPAAPTSSSPAARWLRRGGALAVVALAIAILIWGNQRTEPSLGAGADDPVVVAQQPLPGAIEPRQVDLGAELAVGFDGRLTINGVEIPEEQMQGARDPAGLTAEQLAEEGLRPNNRNRAFFRPGPGQVIEQLPRGEVQITVDYFRDRAPDQDRGSISWTITVN
jgi:hypothetical protein